MFMIKKSTGADYSVDIQDGSQMRCWMGGEVQTPKNVYSTPENCDEDRE